MNCPVCKVPFIIVERNNIEIDYCIDCKGFWLDKGELELLAEILEINKEVVNLFKLPSTKSTEKIYKCPKCSKPMRKVKINNVILDVCPDGDGIWFDAGELSKVLKNDNGNSKMINFLGEMFIK